MTGEDCSSDIFAKYSPDDFEFSVPQAVWEQPCWIRVCNGFRAVKEPAKSEFWLPLTFDFRVDAFARKSQYEQLGAQWWRLYEHARKAGSRLWPDFLCRRNEDFHRALEETYGLLKPPFRYVPRSEFQSVTLDVVLAQDPETMVIYVAEDTNSSGNEIYTLRIHSSLWHYRAGQDYLWYQKTLPRRLHPEDVLLWFHATIKKLRKRCQPRDLTAWDEKLIEAEPDLAPPALKLDGQWSERSKLVLIFGTPDEVGYAALYHLERERIQSLIRRGSEISIRATIANQYQKDPEKLWWTLHLLAPSSLHAERLESRLLSGGQIHFGIGDDISGMIACHQDSVQAVNVEPKTLKRLCGKDGMVLALISAPRFKHKSYTYWPADQPLLDVFSGAL
jgi:hypothetical protein